MTERAYTASSTHKKITRDVSFATSLGRDSPFDPFKERDLSKMSGKTGPSSTLMYFAQKPGKRCPAPVAINKAADRVTLNLAREVTDVFYDVKQPPTVKDVSFTKASRFPQERQRPSSVAEANDENSAHRSRARSEHSADLRSQSESRQRKRPNSSLEHSSFSLMPKGPSIGRTTGRDGKAMPTPSASPPIRAASSEPFSSDRRAQHFVLPWERSVAEEADTATAEKQRVTEKEAVSTTATGKAPPVLEDAEDEERWEAKRKQFIARFGLLGAGQRSDRTQRKTVVRAPNLDTCPQRTAPMNWQTKTASYDWHKTASGTEDLGACYKVTSKTRSIPHAEIGRVAQRERPPKPYVQTVNRLLNPDHISRLHQSILAKARQKNAGLTQSVEGTQRNDSSGLELEGGRKLSAADDFMCHPETHGPPMLTETRLFRGAPSLGLYATRHDEPLDSLLAVTNNKKRRNRRGRSPDSQ